MTVSPLGASVFIGVAYETIVFVGPGLRRDDPLPPLGALVGMGVLGVARFPIAGLLWRAFRLPSKPCFGNDKRSFGRLRCGGDGWEIRVVGLSGMGAALFGGWFARDCRALLAMTLSMLQKVSMVLKGLGELGSMLPCSHAPMLSAFRLIFAVLGLALVWAVPGFAQISFDASSTTGGAIRPGFSTTCNAASLGAIRTNVGVPERCDGASWVTLGSGGGSVTVAGDRIVSTSANIVVGNGGTISLTTGGVSGTAYFDTVGRLVVPGISVTTAQASFTTLSAQRISASVVSATAISVSALTVGGVAVTGSGGVDDVPSAFDFVNSMVAKGQLGWANSITVTGLGTVPVMVAASGVSSARVSIDGGSLVRYASVVEGQTVQLYISASALSATTHVAFVNIGSVSDTWVATNDSCGFGRQYFSGTNRCYVHDITTRNWTNARTYCLGLGGGYDMAVPDSAAEQAFISNLVAGNTVWIGISDTTVEGQYRNLLGISPTYVAWGSGQPDNSGGNEDCIETGVTWNDLNCTSFRPVVCEGNN